MFCSTSKIKTLAQLFIICGPLIHSFIIMCGSETPKRAGSKNSRWQLQPHSWSPAHFQSVLCKEMGLGCSHCSHLDIFVSSHTDASGIQEVGESNRHRKKELKKNLNNISWEFWKKAILTHLKDIKLGSWFKGVLPVLQPSEVKQAPGQIVLQRLG